MIKGNEIKDIIICINKMDSVNWSENVFWEIWEALEIYLKFEHMNNISIWFIPISAFRGENIIEKYIITWYKGKSFLNELLSIEKPISDCITKPLRMTIKNVYKSSGSKKKGFCLTVKLEGGCLSLANNEKLRIMPSEIAVHIKGIF